MRLLALAFLLVASCTPRTTLVARPKDKAPPPTYVGDNGCMVQDFDAATDVPQGAKNIGWVEVTQVEGQSDDDVFVKMRQAVCAKGGDALSQAAWVRETDGTRAVLRANAWTLP